MISILVFLIYNTCLTHHFAHPEHSQFSHQKWSPLFQNQNRKLQFESLNTIEIHRVITLSDILTKKLEDLKQAVEFVRVMLWNYQEFNYYSFGQFHVMLRLIKSFLFLASWLSFTKIIQLNLQIKDTKRRSYSLLIECIRWLSKTLFLVTSPPLAVSYIFKYGPSPTRKSILPFPNRVKDCV